MKSSNRTAKSRAAKSPIMCEPLEKRELLSAVYFQAFFGAGFGGNRSLPFSEVPAVVQAGLTSLASTDSLSAPASTQRVLLGNRNGVESYTITEKSTGEIAQLTVDANGAALAAPTIAKTTYGALTDTAVTTEISSIVTALNLATPASTAKVLVSTPAVGVATYTITLNKSSGKGGLAITVDANGNPVGNETLPLAALPSAIQSGLTAAAPTGATALTSTSAISIKTLNGVTTYTTHYTGTGLSAKVTVDELGNAASLPGKSTIAYSAVPAAASSALQMLATDDGATGTIGATQNVQAYDEGNGTTTLYTVTLTATKTASNGHAYSYPVTLTVDQAGNPTVLPENGGGVFGGLFGGLAANPFGGLFGGFGGFGFGRC